MTRLALDACLSLTPTALIPEGSTMEESEHRLTFRGRFNAAYEAMWTFVAIVFLIGITVIPMG